MTGRCCRHRRLGRLDATEINAALDSRRYREAVNDDIRQARRPRHPGRALLRHREPVGISGAQPSELFSQALDQAWRESNPLVMWQPEGDDTAACGPDGCAI